MMSLIKLQIATGERQRHDSDPRVTQTDYEQSLPFFRSPSGLLVHRVRRLYQLESYWLGKNYHIIDYWCENSGKSHDIDNQLFGSDLPKDWVLCARCEGAAIAAGLPSAKELAGRHVHVGGVRVVQYCCKQESN